MLSLSLRKSLNVQKHIPALLLLSNCMPQSLWNLNRRRDPIFPGADFNVAPVLEGLWTQEQNPSGAVGVCVCVCG